MFKSDESDISDKKIQFCCDDNNDDDDYYCNGYCY